MKPSVFKQAEAYPIPAPLLRTSPRHWNPGLLDYGDQLWLAYRFHRREAKQRCGIAICPLDPANRFRPSEESQFLKFRGITGDEHHEDCRLFLYKGEPHIAYTEMRGYRPGVDYTSVMKYARLSLNGGRWKIEEEFWPQYGSNSGFSKEKNWVFFDDHGKLRCIYSDYPRHVVFEVREHDVVDAPMETTAPVWHWGAIRGGSNPVWLPERQAWLTIFHSRLTEPNSAPHYVRYYAGAYTFEPSPPFRITQISQVPILSGSEEDGHQVDPRYVEGWKPFVVFPCGLVVESAGTFLISLGINDWQCAIARMTMQQMELGAVDGSSFRPRYFTAANGSLPVKYLDDAQRVRFLSWTVPKAGRAGMVGRGYMECANARDAAEAMEHPGATEINIEEYKRAVMPVRSMVA